MKLKPCEHCGNKSNLLDKRGGCISCGGPREEKDEEYRWPVLSSFGTAVPNTHFRVSNICSTNGSDGEWMSST